VLSRRELQGFVGLRPQIYELFAIAAFAEVAVDYSNKIPKVSVRESLGFG